MSTTQLVLLVILSTLPDRTGMQSETKDR